MKPANRENINDSARALHALAKLMPKLSSQRTLTELLQTINHTFGAQLSWVMMEDDSGQQQFVSVGELTCYPSEIKAFLTSTLLQRYHRAWRVICWKENTGTLIFPSSQSGYSQLQCGVLYKLSPQHDPCNGYFFLGFTQPQDSITVLKEVVVILVEKLKDYLTGLVARERTAKEMQRVITQYKTLFERAPVLMNSFDKHSRCVLWNAECEKVFGWTMAEINAHTDPLALFYPDPEVRRRVRESVNTTPLNDMYEWHPVRRDGAQLTILWSNISLPDGSILNIGLDITARKKAEQQLEMKATTDDLTRCLNRFAILQQIGAALEASRGDETESHFSVMMLDLDFFKQINDKWGHLVGDAALVHFCDCLRALLPAGAALGRVGGEEFLLLLPNTRSDAAVQISMALRQSLSLTPLKVGSRSLTLSFSAGVVEVSGKPRDTSSLLISADRALYDAKRGGRGKTIVAVDYL
ncbi:sensor domain-containing diguanylate cyclase [Leclercia adecarboxylata]|uniref:GGDEF domain-containing protein n=1 Tax=Leclercia adecarboxylata TaxID=83655 RepID=UPI002029D0C6|nr:sensor domain-containing diguanylate cyclase [Leclercia adecarboxylata]URN99558.1 sensor domain-containing diguanylate cyclase [Leclercia adecarboxylata]